MRSFTIGTSIFVAWAACQIGCSGGKGSNGRSAASFPDAVREALCRHLEGCGELADAASCDQVNFAYVVGSEFGREVLGLAGGVWENPTLLAAISRGDTVFDDAKAAACVDAIAQASCDLTSQSQSQALDLCREITLGNRADGAACTESFECRSQLCAQVSCHEACCPGACWDSRPTTPAKIGASCAKATCEAGAFCDVQTATCTALKAKGAACAYGQCAAELDCVGLPSGTCQPLPALGEPCTEECRDEGTRCDAKTSTCVRALLAGAACTKDSECGVVYDCDGTQHCTLGLPDGAPCKAGDRCAGDFGFCVAPDGTSGICTLPGAESGACEQDVDCASESCDMTSKRCVAPVCP